MKKVLKDALHRQTLYKTGVAKKGDGSVDDHLNFLFGEHSKTLFLLNYGYMNKGLRDNFFFDQEIERVDGTLRDREKKIGARTQVE
jgi:hypothetical protein